MPWMYLLIAGLLEVVWAMGLKYSEGFTIFWPSVVTVTLLVFSFYLFSKAMKQIPIGTAYAVFTGIGTVGTAVVGMLYLGEVANTAKILFVLLLISGIVGLKLVSSDEEGGKEERSAS
ncbi:DMT family transporter [Brevibacillus dissolubilis]|uniref:DMT family transporter n=1 Tax=Brevibacillus dissolubilis TaxID=1844116 RepID=UPI001116AD64|nr:multidrug efflux SMR transporter [Brevibacillus dissolubilis]